MESISVSDYLHNNTKGGVSELRLSACRKSRGEQGETPRWGFPSLIAPQSNSPFPAFFKERGISRSAERDQSAQYGKPMSLQANSPLETAIFREKSSKAFISLRALHLFYHGIPKGISYPLARFGAELHLECIADTTLSTN